MSVIVECQKCRVSETWEICPVERQLSLTLYKKVVFPRDKFPVVRVRQNFWHSTYRVSILRLYKCIIRIVTLYIQCARQKIWHSYIYIYIFLTLIYIYIYIHIHSVFELIFHTLYTCIIYIFTLYIQCVWKTLFMDPIVTLYMNTEWHKFRRSIFRVTYILAPYLHGVCNTLQHTATHCNTLQHTATHCNTLQHTV